jgi:hypothetical protein
MAFKVIRPDHSELDLGPPLELLQAFREMARVARRAEDPEWENLYYIPQTDEEPIPEDIWPLMQAQAAGFLARHGARLSEHARWILEELAKTSEDEEDEP